MTFVKCFKYFGLDVVLLSLLLLLLLWLLLLLKFGRWMSSFFHFFDAFCLYVLFSLPIFVLFFVFFFLAFFFSFSFFVLPLDLEFVPDFDCGRRNFGLVWHDCSASKIQWFWLLIYVIWCVDKDNVVSYFKMRIGCLLLDYSNISCITFYQITKI